MLKDEAMAELVKTGANVAMFVSFSPNGKKRYSVVRGILPDRPIESPLEAVVLLYKAGASNVSIRSFRPEQPDGNPFYYGPDVGFEDPHKAARVAKDLLQQGYHIIINEAIDTQDGGFSGVLHGDVLEFGPYDTPRVVEKENVAILPRNLALPFIQAVYGFNLHVPFPSSYRVELSIHPGPVGYLNERQLIWQVEELPAVNLPRPIPPRWPNLYSQHLGDKAYGLLIGNLLGFPVPRTVVFSRTIPQFEFGFPVNAGTDRWVRTCPRQQQPGLFTTKRGWLDPFALMQREDPKGTQIASIIVQDGVAARWSGAALTTPDGKEVIIEGKRGQGDTFMVGEEGPAKELPPKVYSEVRAFWWKLIGTLGPVRFEWAWDGQRVWLLQLHAGASDSFGDVIYPGEAKKWIKFKTSDGLEKLRAILQEAKQSGFGIELRGQVGITSHLGDVLRRNKIPSRIKRV